MNPGATIWDALSADAPRRYSALGTAGFPWIPNRLGDANVLLVGDAAGYAEPYSGEGIGQAMVSAECAAQAVIAGGEVLKRFAALMRANHRRVVWRTRLISTILSSSLLHFVAARRAVVPHRWLSRLVERVHVTGTL